MAFFAPRAALPVPSSLEVATASGVMAVDLQLHATAHCFRERHRLRIQVSSGAHPRYARNTGTGEAIGETTRLVPAEVEILHDQRHKSAITLPVWREA